MFLSKVRLAEAFQPGIECDDTLLGTNISHVWKRKIIVPATFEGDMLVPWRVVVKDTDFCIHLWPGLVVYV